MNILRLDEYSIGEVFNYLNIESHKNFANTCKKFHEFSKQNYNLKNFENDLQNKLIDTLYNTHNRDDIPENIRLKYEVVFSLKALQHTVNISQYLGSDINHDRMTGNNRNNVMNQLVLKSVTCCSIKNTLQNLCEIGFQARFDFNFWYAFKIGESETVYLCNVKHPEFEIRNKNFEYVAIAIYYNEKTEDQKFYGFEVGRFDWYVSELSGFSSTEFSNSFDVFKPICGYIRMLFKNNTTMQRKITPKLLLNLANFDCCQLNSNTEVLKNEEIQKLVKTLKANFAHQISLIDHASVIEEFLSNLKYYYSLGSVDYTLMTSLADFVRPVMKLLSIFNYGELLPYLPVVKLLLQCVDFDQGIAEKYKEIVCIVLNNNERLQVEVIDSRTEFVYKMTLNSGTLFTVSKDGSSKRGNTSKANDILLKIFEKFAETNLDPISANSLPIMTLKFIFMFLDNLLIRSVMDIFEIRNMMLGI